MNMYMEVEVFFVEDNLCDVELMLWLLWKYYFVNYVVYVKDG